MARRPPAPRPDAQALVAEAYRGVLGREPDAGGLAYYSEQLAGGMTLAALLADFVASEEFAAPRRPVDEYLRVDEDPKLEIELELSPSQIQALWSHIAAVWGELGDGDVYWSVLSAPEYLGARADDAALMAGFYESGRAEVARMQAWLGRNHLAIRPDMLCAEYGSGVGRSSVWLARLCGRLRAFDISQGHLRHARDWADRLGVRTVEYVLVRDPADLGQLAGIDLFFSVLVLQHNPPPIIRMILEAAFAGLNPGGIAFFQLPTYRRGYRFELADYLATTAAQGAIEMHCLPQQEVFAIAARHGVVPLEIEQDGLAGDCGTSHSFLFRKPT